MTFSETCIAGTAIGLLLVVAALGVDHVRTDLKRRQVAEVLATLDRALKAYHAAGGHWPGGVIESKGSSTRPASQPASAPSFVSVRPVIKTSPPPDAPIASDGRDDKDPGSRGDPRAPFDHATAEVFAALADVPASQAILREIRPILWVESQAPKGWQAGPPVNLVQDSWGRTLRCLTARSDSEINRQAVAANGGKPIFISAGEDGEFESEDGSAAADNIRSDELAR